MTEPDEGLGVDDESRDIGELLKVLSEPMRFRIVQLLLQRHHCARSLSKVLGISESAVSQHMGVLRRHDLVSGLRHGYHIHYVLNRGVFEGIVGEMQSWLALMDAIGDCHKTNPCSFRDEDGSCGCIYRKHANTRDSEEHHEDRDSE